jgi:hypothetical protein
MFINYIEKGGNTMAEKRYKSLSNESHETAAWASEKCKKPGSKVSIPQEFQVENAKGHVDSNEK